MEHVPIDLDAPLSDTRGTVVVDTESGRALLRVTGSGDRLKVVAHLEDGRAPKLEGVHASRSLRQAAATLAASRPLRAFLLPNAGVDSVYRPVATVMMILPFVLGGAMAAAGLFWESIGWVRFVILTGGLALLVIAADAMDKARRYRQWAALKHGERVKAAELELPPLQEEFDVDDVKEEYGKLLSDIVYRIENPALFDAQEPVSKAFTLALLQWDNNDGVATPDERRALAHRVRATFTAAKANAERLGMDHLPEVARAKARTALKAAVVAADKSAPEPERETALRRAVAILDDLALYYLPTGSDARKAITGRGAPQLPGRRNV
ncbi:MAG TPA: hypothetical protein K8V15_05775 [Tessaracoccus flavescens]|uniref:Uncharacterized protein n=1 Tax=Tessaracoccus flavescens TaxID=399497 RepID=A0A921JRG0_9ACTN|nr:hypothetical protein [Tessaracoccus flavescens]